MTKQYCDPGIVIESAELESRLTSPNLRIIDCNLALAPKPGGGYLISSGQADWEEAHIPNSCYIDLHKELSADHPTLRFMLPTAVRFEQLMSQIGIGNEHDIVVYSRGANAWATRLFLMFREFGCHNVRVLNGGWDKWADEQRSVSTQSPEWPAAQFSASPPAGDFVGKGRVLAAIDESQTCVVNALSPESFSGAVFNPTYGRPGRIKGSVNLPAGELIDPDSKKFLDANTLREKFAGTGALEAENIITYCGGGISATTDAFALLLLGQSGVTVYDGSMMEWGADPDLPMESDQDLQ